MSQDLSAAVSRPPVFQTCISSSKCESIFVRSISTSRLLLKLMLDLKLETSYQIQSNFERSNSTSRMLLKLMLASMSKGPPLGFCGASWRS